MNRYAPFGYAPPERTLSRSGHSATQVALAVLAGLLLGSGIGHLLAAWWL